MSIQLGLFAATLLLTLGASSHLVWSADDGHRAAPLGVVRYHFVPGQQLTYRSKWTTTYWRAEWNGARIGLVEEQMDFNIRALRANPDGSYRMLVRLRDKTIRTRGGIKYDEPPDTQIFYADVFLDGRELPSHWRLTWGNAPPSLFPPLPPDATAGKAGWNASPQEFLYRCKLIQWVPNFVFDAKIQTPYDKTLGDSHVVRYTFDAGRGLISNSSETFARNGSMKGAGGGKCELLAVDTIAPGALKALASEADRYFAAVDTYDAHVEEASKAAPENAVELLSLAVADLKLAAASLLQPDMKRDADERINHHDAVASEVLKSIADRANRIGKAAPDFETTDLDGKKVRLSDFRGKVVVLDFWYRGCGPCIRTMPQVNELADDFAGQPVAILGMNTDADPANARFVARELALKYPTLHARDLSAKFGVEGFPTLILIDPHGILRMIHVGYSATLRDEMGAAIRRMMDKK